MKSAKGLKKDLKRKLKKWLGRKPSPMEEIVAEYGMFYGIDIFTNEIKKTIREVEK